MRPAGWQERQLLGPCRWSEWYDRAPMPMSAPRELESGGVLYQFRPVYALSEEAIEALEFAAAHISSDWPERCQEIVRRVRAALSATKKPESRCEAKRQNNGVCPHHNLHCGYPGCES